MVFFSMKNRVIIDFSTGEKIGLLKSCDLEVDEESGKINSILLPRSKFATLFSGDSDYTKIPWECVRKIGVDTIIVEL